MEDEFLTYLQDKLHSASFDSHSYRRRLFGEIIQKYLEAKEKQNAPRQAKDPPPVSQ